MISLGRVRREASFWNGRTIILVVVVADAAKGTRSRGAITAFGVIDANRGPGRIGVTRRLERTATERRVG